MEWNFVYCSSGINNRFVNLYCFYMQSILSPWRLRNSKLCRWLYHFIYGKNHDLVVEKLEQSSGILLKWLKNNYTKVDMDKSHLLLSRKTQKASKIDGNIIESENNQILLGILIDSISHLKKISITCLRKWVKS